MTRDEFEMLKNSIIKCVEMKKDVLKGTVEDLTAQAKAVEGKSNPFADESDIFRHIIELQTREVESYADGVEFVLDIFEKMAIKGE